MVITTGKKEGAMTLRARIGLVVVWIASLVLVGVMGNPQAPIAPKVVPLPTPTVVSGSDLGFRIDGLRGNAPVGRFVIRRDATGPWVEPELSGDGVKRLAAK
jgi:hypothetical protein